MNGHELLALLAPPLALVDWLETVFSAKRQKGESIPAEFQRYLDLWVSIRSDEPSAIDGTPAAAWEQVGDLVTQTKRELAF